MDHRFGGFHGGRLPGDGLHEVMAVQGQQLDQRQGGDRPRARDAVQQGDLAERSRGRGEAGANPGVADIASDDGTRRTALDSGDGR
jgi:hypothetical protein